MALIFDGREIFLNELRDDDTPWEDSDFDTDDLDTEIIWDDELDSFRD